MGEPTDSLVVTDDLVGHGLVGLGVGDLHGGTEDHLAGVRQGGHVDHLGILQAPFDIADPRLDHALLFAGGVVLGVLLEVTQLTRLGDGLGDLRTQLGLEVLELVFQGTGALDGHGVLGHALTPACRSCSRRTVFSAPNFKASQMAWPPAMVVVQHSLCCSALRRME